MKILMNLAQVKNMSFSFTFPGHMSGFIKTGKGQDVHLPLLGFPAMAACRILGWGDE